MPTNLYGPGDNYHPENSHVIPALIRRFHEAKTKKLSEVIIWGTGTPRREFLHADDLAEAATYVMELPKNIWHENSSSDQYHVNVGYGTDISIAELAKLIADVVSFQGKISFDFGKPDGTPRKLFDSNKIWSLGWRPKIDLATGLKNTYGDLITADEFY